MPWLSIAVIVYGIAVAAGGVMGKTEGHSNASLITGGVSGLIIIVAGILSRQHPRSGYGLAALMALLLAAFFTYKLITTHKMMPPVPVISMSVLMLILLAVGHFMKR